MRAEKDGESLGEIPVERMRSVKVGDAANHVEFQEFPGDEGEAAVAERIEGGGGDDGDDADYDRPEEEAPPIRSGDLFGEQSVDEWRMENDVRFESNVKLYRAIFATRGT